MMTSLIDAYETGAITASHLIARSLELIDPADPGLVLDLIPVGCRERLRGYLDQAQAGSMRSNHGTRTTPDQVEAASRWLRVLELPREVRPVRSGGEGGASSSASEWRTPPVTLG